MSSRFRTVLVAILGLGLIVWLSEPIGRELKPRDLLEYWAAGRLNARGENPYDPELLLRTQQIVDPSRDGAVMMWNPPWSLALYMPLGYLTSAGEMTLIWTGLQLATVIAASLLLWSTYGGDPRRRWVALLFGLTFAPVLWMVLWGQNTGLAVLGLSGFVYFRKLDRPALAGAFAALTALKPHLLAVLGVLLVADAMCRRGRIALQCGGGILLLSLGLAMATNPDVIAQYRQAIRDPGPHAEALDQWVLPVASYWLRVEMGIGFWMQFVPCIIACSVAVAYRAIRGTNWNWADELPRMVWISVLVTPYGGWIFDLTVLLVPMLALLARLTLRGTVALLIVNMAISAITLIGSFSLPGFFWVAPAILLMALIGSVMSNHSELRAGEAKRTGVLGHHAAGHPNHAVRR